MAYKQKRKPPAVTSSIFIAYVLSQEQELNLLWHTEMETLASTFNLCVPAYT